MKIVTSIILCITAWAGAQGLPAPVLAYPADGAKDVTVYATLKWKKVAGATAYHVQIATDLGFAAMFREDSALADTAIKMNKFADSTAYYWRVRARNDGGFGPFSKTRLLTSQPPLGLGPLISNPPDYSLDLPTTVQLAWEAFPGAASYHLQVSLVTNFATLVMDDSLLKGTTKTLGPLNAGVQYFWHVRALGPTLPGLKTAWSKGTFFTAGEAGTAGHASRFRPGFSIRAAPGGGVEVDFSLAARSAARITVANLEGRTLATAVEGVLEAGAHRTRALAPGDAPGIYLIRMEAAGQRLVGRVFLP